MTYKVQGDRRYNCIFKVLRGAGQTGLAGRAVDDDVMPCQRYSCVTGQAGHCETFWS